MTGERKPRAVDWADVHARLARARAALEGRSAPSPEERREILKRRAERAAAREDPGRRPGELALIEFVLAHEIYAAPREFVVEVDPLREFAPLPNVPAHFLGVTSLRGRMLSVVDLRRFFGLPNPGLTDMNRLIVLAEEGVELALIADQVRGVSRVALESVAEPLPGGNASRASFCRGIAPGGIIVLDVPRLLAARELVGASQAINRAEERR